MKKYNFDYIDKSISGWSKDMRSDSDMIKGLPFGIMMPFITGIDEEGRIIESPMRDMNGEVIDDINEWIRQREEYCEELAKRV